MIAKPEHGIYEPGKRAMIKVKHVRTADCVVAGFRWHKNGKGTLVGSLLLGLHDDEGKLQHVGVTSSFTMAMRKELALELAPLREHALDGHPWRAWADAGAGEWGRMPGGQSRWSAGKDLSWEPLRIERVCEVKYDHMQGDRFRHAAVFLRWRPDKPPADCGYDQLEVTPAYELEKVFGAWTMTLRASSSVFGLRSLGVAWRPQTADRRQRQAPGRARVVAFVVERLPRRARVTLLQSFGVSSGSSASCGGRCASGHVLQVHADARPGVKPAAHRVDQHVGRFEVRGRVGMARFPAGEPGERILLLLRAGDLDERVLGRASPRGLTRARVRPGAFRIA